MRAISRRLVLAAVAVPGLAACQKIGPDPARGDMELGNPSAKVTVIEYASASCPHCAAFNNEVFPQFRRKYVDNGRVRYIYREFLTPPVQVAAASFMLARCGGKDRYFPILDAVYHANQEMYASGDFRGVLVRVARRFGINEAQFTKCITDQKAFDALNARVHAATDKDKIAGTPTFIINGKTYGGEQSMAQLDAAIQPLL